MNIAPIFAELAGAGVVVFTDGGNIMLHHKQPLDQSLLNTIRSHKPEILSYLNQPNYCLWFYKVDLQCGYTQMGLMTSDHQQAQKQLEVIYSKPITSLQRRQ